ncbi:hypothetical protein OKW21_006001 [Catalinimonas alkaloidigena]|uniref:beta strand repeat-containing protein n=1 Tax=Catalinimonas alkaloidigena TaxID=1075417 RepID=UPI0024066794|nr:hypothetical protein [Catalinimonas alkaloidigena]MDF9800738.1 hypothetical protein [Catalinimonas alkaloidigena]
MDTNVDESTNTIVVSTSEMLNQYAFTAGSNFTSPTIYYSRADGAWDDMLTWSTDPSGVPMADTVPSANNPVIIQFGHTVTIPATTHVYAANTSIENNGELVIEEINGDTYVAIGTVGGTGTLKFSVDNVPDIPTLDNDFVNSGGGTVEYEFISTRDEDLPDTQTVYNHLIIDHQGGNDEARMTTNYTINGNLSVVSGRLDLNSHSCDRSTTGGTFTMVGGTELWVEGSDNFPVNYSTYSLDPSSTVRYRYNNNVQFISDLGGASYGNINFERTGGTLAPKHLSGDIHVSGKLDIFSRVELHTNDHDIFLAGEWERDARNNSAFVPGEGTVTFNGSILQEIDIVGEDDSETFGNIIIDNAAGVEVNTTSSVLTYLDIEENLTIRQGSLNMNGQPLNLSGDLINNSSSTAPVTNTSIVSFNSTAADQAIGGSNGVVLEDIILEKAQGTSLILDTLLTINGTLNWSNEGTISLVNDALSFGPSSDINGSFGINRMIVTTGTTNGPEVVKQGNTNADSYDFTFPLGVSGRYTPLVVDATAISGSGSIAVRSVTGNTNGNFTLLEAGRAIDRFFSLNLTGISSLRAALDFTYADTDVQGSEINYLSWVYEGSPITTEASNGFVTAAANTFGSTDVTITNAATEWIAAEAGAFFPKLYSIASDDWNVATTWNTAIDGSGSNAIPTQYNDVEIQSGDVITVGSNASVASMQLDGQLEITSAASGYDLGVLTGSGKLTLNSGELPTYNALGSTLFDNGTIEYSGGGDYNLPDSRTQYKNLEISGGGTKTMLTNITVLNDLTIDAATLDAHSTNNYNLSLGGSLSLQNSGNFEPHNGEFALIGSSAQSVPSGISFNNLRFDNVGTKSINTAGTLTVNNFRILASSGQVSFITPTNVEISGNWSNAAGAAAYTNVEDLDLSGSANQNIIGTNTFHNLTINKSGAGPVVTATGTITLDDGSNGGSMTISADDIVNGSANYNLLGDWSNSGSFSTTGTVNFNGALAQDISGNNTFGSLIIDNAVGVNMADDVITTINSDLTVTSGTPLNTGGGTATVVFDGTGAQNINGSVTFNNLTKLTGTILTLSGSSVVNGELTLGTGVINTTNSDMLTIGTNGSVSGGSTTSYIDGPLRHLESSTAAKVKRFPFGNNGVYRPITLNLAQADATERSYTAVLTEGPPAKRTLPTVPEKLLRVSGARHYSITQSPAAAVSSATVTIEYNADDEVDDGPALRIAKSDGAGNWVNIGGGGSSPDPADPGVFTSGIITSGTFTTFSDFVLASSSAPNNPLPIELLYFGGQVDEEQVHLILGNCLGE